MIDQELKTKIKSVIGTRYAKPIIDYLNSKGVYTENGEPYKTSSIRGIVNATSNRENLLIEGHIIDLLEITQNKRKKHLDRWKKVTTPVKK